MTDSGVYKILNIINSKVYIGSSFDISKKWGEHLKSLRKNIHYNSYLQNAFNKYKENNFKFEVIEYCPNEKLPEREQFYINFYKSSNRKYGYNLSPTAGSPMENRKHTDETKQKISIGNKGKKRTEEQNKKQSELHKGKKYPKKGRIL
jgi:group I intron endonuclease